jgi:ribosomal protein L37E
MYVMVHVTVLVRCGNSSLQVLQKYCEETGLALTKKSKEEKSLVKNEAQHGDIQSVMDVLKECWNSVHFFWCVL